MNYAIQAKARNAKTTCVGRGGVGSRNQEEGFTLKGVFYVKEHADKINYATTNSWTMTTKTMQAR